jgi:4-aminobutyrate aminotransferase-like enzyme
LEEGLVEKANALGKHFVDRLKPHQLIKSFRGKGLFIAVELEDKALVKKVMDHCFEKGLLFDLFLFNETGFRIAPPLTISEKEVDKICDIILWAMEESLNS